MTKQERIDKIVKALTDAAQEVGLDGVGVVCDLSGNIRLLMLGDADEVAEVANYASDIYGYDENVLVMERGEDDDRLN
jgi:hypothetical protein